MPQGTCTVDDCLKPIRSSGSPLCGMHYHRQYRHGDVHRTANDNKVLLERGARYPSTSMPNHPLATKCGRVYIHRAVLYDSIGPGFHPCHWCSVPVTWDFTVGDPDCLYVDHLNGQRDDNRLENLVPSCPRCNVARGSQAKSRALRAAGWWSNHDTVDRLAPRLAPIETNRGGSVPDRARVGA